MSKIGGKIIDGLRDALQYAEGETTGNKEHRVLIPERVDVAGWSESWVLTV